MTTNQDISGGAGNESESSLETGSTSSSRAAAEKSSPRIVDMSAHTRCPACGCGHKTMRYIDADGIDTFGCACGEEWPTGYDDEQEGR